MVAVLASYAQGSWFTPDADGRPIRDATTGEEVARVSSEGVDHGGMLRYAREVGGPALRRITFRQRAEMVRALAKDLGEHKQRFYDLSTHTGATRADAAFDVEGGLNALFVLANQGRTGLPEDTVLIDGEVDRLGKRGTFVGQHLLVPLRGVAVHINAFNFPVWGLLEKLAPALIAGMPCVVKPATQTAFVTHAVVERIVESGLLPTGALQLVCGGAGDLMDHLTGQDVVAFTGSGSTAELLRSHPAVASRGTRFNAETDSLNAIVLGPDAGPGTPELDLFVSEVVHETTHKTGQKCTAVRRALVPREVAADVLEALRSRFSAVTVGDPTRDGVTMGPLVSTAQRDDVRGAVRVLRGGAQIVHGDPDDVEAVAGDVEQGAFMSPVLLWCDDPARPEPHEVEAFGPVCTVMPYDSLDHVVDLLARGQGSLVATLVSHDPDVVRRLAVDAAAWHGRLLVLDRDDARESTGHGSVLAQLVHGGPGRAGGGEELGGLRAFSRYLQRTAVQASPDMLTAVTGRWVPGAARTVTDEHPFRRYLEDLRPGDALVSRPRTVTLEDIDRFVALTGDSFYAHTDEDAAKANPFFEGRVAHGYLVIAIAAGLFVEPAPGPVLANYGIDSLRFVTPVYPGDALTVTLTAKDIRPRKGYGEVAWDADVTNQDDVSVARYDVLTMVSNRPTS